jgi:c-di-GMP-binding flagellar brake protein YcgR
MAQEPDMFDRRTRNRFVEQNDVLIRTSMNKYQGAGIAAHTYDLSTGGARIVTSKSFAIGSVIRVRVNLAGTDQFVNLDGEVKWLRANDDEGLFEIGVEFLHLTSHDVLTLLRHLYGRSEGIPSTVA